MKIIQTPVATTGHLMDAIYRVDGNRVVTSPDAAGPRDIGMHHGSAPAALAVWAAEAIPTPPAVDAECHESGCATRPDQSLG
jgi:hypothetical protein